MNSHVRLLVLLLVGAFFVLEAQGHPASLDSSSDPFDFDTSSTLDDTFVEPPKLAKPAKSTARGLFEPDLPEVLPQLQVAAKTLTVLLSEVVDELKGLLQGGLTPKALEGCMKKIGVAIRKTLRLTVTEKVTTTVSKNPETRSARPNAMNDMVGGLQDAFSNVGSFMTGGFFGSPPPKKESKESKEPEESKASAKVEVEVDKPKAAKESKSKARALVIEEDRGAE